MPDEEGMALYRLAADAAALGYGPLLEVGTYCGRSTLYLGTGAREGGAHLFSVDHHRGSEELQPGWEHHDPELVGPGGAMDSLPWARRAVAEAGLEGSVALVVGESAAVAAAWGTPLALVFIDGGHGSRPAWDDYRGWAPKVAAGGFLAIHDVFEDPAEGGRPPFEIYQAALRSGEFADLPARRCGSLRVLRRSPR